MCSLPTIHQHVVTGMCALYKMGPKVLVEWTHEGPQVLCFYNSPFPPPPNKFMSRIMETVLSRKYCWSLFTYLSQFYPQIMDSLLFMTIPRKLKKIEQFTLRLFVSVRICRVLTVLSWLITASCLSSGKERPSLVYVCERSCFLSASPLSVFLNRKGNNQLLYCESCEPSQWHKSALQGLWLRNDNKKNKTKCPRTQPSSQRQCYYDSENRSHGAAVTVNMSPFYWQMFHLNKHNQDLGRFTLAAANADECSLICPCPSCFSSCSGKCFYGGAGDRQLRAWWAARCFPFSHRSIHGNVCALCSSFIDCERA